MKFDSDLTLFLTDSIETPSCIDLVKRAPADLCHLSVPKTVKKLFRKLLANH